MVVALAIGLLPLGLSGARLIQQVLQFFDVADADLPILYDNQLFGLEVTECADQGFRSSAYIVRYIFA